MRRGIAYLVSTLAIFISSTAHADRVEYSVHPDDNVANHLNRGQLAQYRARQGAAAAAVQAQENSIQAGGVVSIVVFRGDGGDPGQLRIDDPANFTYARSGFGEDHVYQNGREVQINPALRETVKQIALRELGTPRADLAAATRPPSFAALLDRFATNGAPPSDVRAHIVTRQDTARAAELQARDMLALEAKAGVALAQGKMLELVKTVMRSYGLKSDACDDSRDPRCDRPGVREAFAEIKREEAGRL